MRLRPRITRERRALPPAPPRRVKLTLTRLSSGPRSVTRTSAPAEAVNASTFRIS